MRNRAILENVRWQAAHPANYTVGRQGNRVELLVIHLMDGSQEGTAAWFANPRANASAHFGVSAKGDLDQYVSEADTAWHAGRWSVNVRSIGIEHEGRQVQGQARWRPTNAQFQASVALAAELCRRYSIGPGAATIVPHSAISPRKPLCPGEGFPLERYTEAVKKRLLELDAEDLYVPVRLFHPETNEQVGEATLIRGSDKVYLKSLDGKDYR